MTRVLVVGAGGALGQAVCPALAGFAEVLAAGRRGGDLALDLAAPADEIVLPRGLDAVINLAACTSGADAVAMENTNALGVLKLARACAAAGVGRLVQVSSIFATLGAESPFFGAYALSKRHGEELARLASTESGLPLAILRPTRLYGAATAQLRHQPLLATIVERAAAGEDIEFHGRHDARRNFLHVADLAAVIAAVVRQGITGTWACVGSEDLPLSAIAEAAIAAFGSRSAVRFRPGLADIPDCSFAADDRLYRLTGAWPQIAMAEGMRLAARARGAA